MDLVINQKGLAPIFIVILVTTALVGGYFVYTNYSNNRTKIDQQATQPFNNTQTDSLGHKLSLEPLPDVATLATQTADWQIYNDKLFDFEVRYPPYFIYEVNNYLKSEYPNYWVTFGERSKLPHDLTIVNQCNISVYPPNKRSYSQNPEPSISDEDIWKETITINDLIAERQHGYHSGLYEFEEIYFNQKDQAFLLSWKNDRPRNICELIFSTFSRK